MEENKILYERLLKSEQEKVQLLEKLLEQGRPEIVKRQSGKSMIALVRFSAVEKDTFAPIFTERSSTSLNPNPFNPGAISSERIASYSACVKTAPLFSINRLFPA